MGYVMIGEIEPEKDSEPNDAPFEQELFEGLYHELHRLAAQKMAREYGVQTLEPTALVHEAWLRIGADRQPAWKSQAHLFSAVDKAMRRILIEQARRREVLEKGGMIEREEYTEDHIVISTQCDTLLELDDCLLRLAQQDPVAAHLVELRYFVGMSMPEAASDLGLSLRQAERIWAFARSWLHQAMNR